MPSVCGLPAALSVIESVAARAPAAVGVNVILITHVAFGATAAPFVQVVPAATAKSAAFAPESDAAAVMFRLAFPVFFTVTACALLVVLTVWLVNTRADGVTVATGAVATPVPVRLIVCGLPVALSAIVSVADRAPEALGVKVMLMMQLEVGVTGLLVVQVVPLATANSALPVEGADVNVRLPVPLFITVTLCALLVVPTGCERRKIQRGRRGQHHRRRRPGAAKGHRLGPRRWRARAVVIRISDWQAGRFRRSRGGRRKRDANRAGSPRRQ